MERNKEAYLNYVCPYCWNTLDECICDIFPPYHLEFIDRCVQEHIRILNNKGYYTTGCCEGHMEVCVNTYIAFAQEYFDDNMTLPAGFNYNKKRRMIHHEYKAKQLSQKAFEKEKSEHIERLLLWCKNLPELSNRNDRSRTNPVQKL